MEMNSKMKPVFSLGIVLLPILVFVLLVISLFQNEIFLNVNKSVNQVDSQVEITKPTKLIIVQDEANIREYGVSIGEKKSAFEILKSLNDSNENFSFEYDEFDFGTMVKSLNGKTPGENQFWKFFVNNEESPIGISDVEIKEGDEIKFQLDNVD